MKRIELTKGKFAIVNNEDFEYLNQWRWKYHKDNYACRTITGGSLVYMHRIINKTSKGLLTDHKNRNGLDNRKINLRTVTYSQNALNSKMNKYNTSGYKGVTWDKKNKKWQAGIHIGKKFVFLGRYLDIKDANFARMEGEKRYVL